MLYIIYYLPLTDNSGIRLHIEKNISEILPTHSEMLILPMDYLIDRKEQWTLELINNDLLVFS